MARSALSDYLQVYPFWLMDVAPIEPLALPIFNPLLGFSSITAPEISIETYDIAEGNWLFHHKVAKRADVSNITLQRASQWYDGNFYNWILTALAGDTGGTTTPLGTAGAIGGVTPRRDLLLIQFMSRSPLPAAAASAAAVAGTMALVGTNAGGASGGAAVATAAAGTATALGTVGVGPFEFAPRVPAKAWLLKDCIPTRYKTGGDFDAASSAISLAELDLAVDYFDEISLSI